MSTRAAFCGGHRRMKCARLQTATAVPACILVPQMRTMRHVNYPTIMFYVCFEVGLVGLLRRKPCTGEPFCNELEKVNPFRSPKVGVVSINQDYESLNVTLEVG